MLLESTMMFFMRTKYNEFGINTMILIMNAMILLAKQHLYETQRFYLNGIHVLV